MSRRSGGSSRPTTQPGGGSRPSFGQSGQSRPTTQPGGGSRPSFGQSGQSRPTTQPGGGSRPSFGQSGQSRPTTQPGAAGSRPSFGQQGGSGRPTNNQIGDFLGLPKDGGPSTGQRPRMQPGGQRPGAGRPESTRPDSRPGDTGRDNFGDNRQNRTDNRVDRRDNVGDTRQDRRENVGDTRQDRRENVSDNRQGRVDQRRDRANDVRNDFANNHPRRDFWNDHPRAARWNRPYRWSTWGALTGWFAWGTGTSAAYYDYGGNVYHDEQNVYYGDNAVASTEQYAEQAIGLADVGAQAVEETPDETEWMSLGVFALTHEEKGDPTMFFQLAVTKDGTIAGTYYNSSTKQSKPVQGAVDKTTQRAAWSVGDKRDTVVETGIYNLTEPESAALLHFGTEKTQTWLLVRLEEPAEAQNAP